jgi:hypothetical protein
VASRCKLTPAVAALFLGRRAALSAVGQPLTKAVVLRGGHAAYILIESVEKPTDNSSASLLLLARG